MPRKFRRKTNHRRRRPYGTKARFVPRGLAIKKYNQVATKTFYFKNNGRLGAGPTGNGTALWATQIRTPPPGSYLTPGVPADFLRVSRAYNEYKILAIKVKLFPANVGTESDLPGVSPEPFQRGNCITYYEQSLAAGQQVATQIPQVMNLGSAKMFVPRQRHTRVIYRPKGYPAWGQCDGDIPQPNWRLDPWWGGIFWILNGGTPNGPPVHFYQTTYKVIFRGRNRTPGGSVLGVDNTDPHYTLS